MAVISTLFVYLSAFILLLLFLLMFMTSFITAQSYYITIFRGVYLRSSPGIAMPLISLLASCSSWSLISSFRYTISYFIELCK